MEENTERESRINKNGLIRIQKRMFFGGSIEWKIWFFWIRIKPTDPPGGEVDLQRRFDDGRTNSKFQSELAQYSDADYPDERVLEIAWVAESEELDPPDVPE